MIELRNVSIRAGQFSLNGISFSVKKGEYAVLMGQTGQGKTTLLESICGLKRIQSGQVLIGDVDVTNWSPADREIGYVPQDLALFPNLTVREHIEFALKLRKQSRSMISDRVSELEEVLGIKHLMNRTIHKLSGGESQRVALGRALSFKPAVLLLDEPLSALDEATRNQMHQLLREVARTTHVTTLHITHSEQEAVALSDCRLRLEDGKIVS